MLNANSVSQAGSITVNSRINALVVETTYFEKKNRLINKFYFFTKDGFLINNTFMENNPRSITSK